MANHIEPKAEITIDLTPQEYKEASLLAERQGGYLHPLPLVVLVSAVLLFIGLRSLGWFEANYASMIVPLLLCFCCPLLLVVFFYALPSVLKSRAAVNYKTYKALMQTAVVKLYADDMVTEAPNLTLNDPYALMAVCIETPRLFVLIKDRDRMLVIPKRCIPAERSEEIIAFLRHVFTRRRKVMKSWIF
ncbi:MAG: YcxB family protein [Clostridiales bacterium]|nr:YcxB family protein [Clostridiales bacterium]